MKLFKNGVGRPSNEIKQLRQVFIVSISAIVISIIALLVSLFTNTSIKSTVLKGSASDKNILGDVCGSRVNTGADGRIDVIDALCILKFSAKTKTPNDTQKKNADMNKDGKITAADAKAVINYLKKEFKKGDIDFDGRITNIDSFYIAQYSTGTIEYNEELDSVYSYFADYNGDGKVTAADAKKVLNDGYLIGDANGDGKVSKTDAKCILAYQLGAHNKNKDFCSVKIVKDDDNFKAADVNGDGEVSSTDAVGVFSIMSDGSLWADADSDGVLTEDDAKKILDLSSDKGGKLTKEDKEYLLYLDLNFDNKITAADARIALSLVNVKKGKYGDLNSDGKLTKKDAKEYVIALKKVNFNTDNLDKSVDANKDGKTNNKDLYLMLAADTSGHGDINNDGKLNSADARILFRYLNGIGTKDSNGNTIKVNKKNADLNLDGVIDNEDLNLLQARINIKTSK